MHPWATVRHLFVPDGALHDIIVAPASQDLWQLLLSDLAAQRPSPRFEVDGVQATLPTRVQDVFETQRRASPSLELQHIGLSLITHFFQEDEIDFDYAPADIATESAWRGLHDFVCHISRVLDRRAVVAPEGCPEMPFLRFSPVTNQLELT